MRLIVLTENLARDNRHVLRQNALDALADGERELVVDFTQSPYVDSCGLGVLVTISKRCREVGGTLRLRNLNEELRTLLELTKLDTLLIELKAEAVTP